MRPLAEVRDKAIAAWQAEQKEKDVAKQAEALAAAAKPGGSLAKAAGDKGVTLLAAVMLSRQPAPDQKVPPALTAKLFAAKPGEIVTTAGPTAAYTAQLKEIRSPESVPTAAGPLAERLAREQRRDHLASAFTEALRRRYPVEIQRDALNRMF